MKYLLLALSFLLLAGCAPTTSSQTDTSLRQPAFTLWFDDANRVQRTTTKNEEALQPAWVIVQNGDVVLERNAIGETVYRYFKDEEGVYTIYLKVWTGERYEVASNVVSYRIE